MTYAGLEYGSSGDGWTVTYKITPSSSGITDVKYYTNIANYRGPTHASWYRHSWWVAYGGHSAQEWVKIYHNTMDIDLVLNEMSFLTCTCNSNGQAYLAAGGVINVPAEGNGVTFRARYYTTGSDTDVAICDNNYTVPSLLASQSEDLANYGNVAYKWGAYGKSSTSVNPNFGGCRSGYYVGDDELKYYVKQPDPNQANYMGPQRVTMTFSNPIAVPSQGYIFLVVDVVDWHGGGIENQTLVMLGEDPYFITDITPDDTPYIWRMTDMGDGTRQWQRTRYPFMWSGTEWIKMDEKNSDTISNIENRNK